MPNKMNILEIPILNLASNSCNDYRLFKNTKLQAYKLKYHE